MTRVVAGLIEREGRILIGQRRAEGPHPLKWEFPGGKIEPGESPEAALARELKEELGIEAAIGPEVTRYEYAYPGRAPILLIFFTVEAFAGEIDNRVYAAIEWAPRAALTEYDFLEGDVNFVRRLAGC